MCQSRKGETHPSWEGGRHTDSKGYVNVYCPRHPNARSSGYVREHVLVMSEHLGRALDTRYELVHHKKRY